MPDFEKGAGPDPFELAFTQAHKQLNRRLVFFAEEMVKDRDVATIIVADAFLDLREEHFDFNDVSGACKLLYKMIGFDCIDFHRKRIVQKKRDRKLHYWLSQQSNSDLQGRLDGLTVEEGMAEFMQFLEDEIPNLPPTSRSTLMDIYVKGKSARQIARERGINESSVHDTKNNALKRLRKAFQEKLNTFLLIVIAVIISLVLKKCTGK